MRAIVVLASIVFLGTTAGCASTGSAGSAKGPEPISYSRADFTPPSEFDMSFAPEGVAQGPAIKRSEPANASYKARLVSMEKAGEP